MAVAKVKDDKGNEIIIAESDDTIKIEGNHYFPPDSVKKEYLSDSDLKTICFWKGEANYKTIKAGRSEYLDGAFYYPKPMPDALKRVGKDFSNYFSFWQGVEVED